MNLPPDDRRPGLAPPRFGLATLMWAIAVLGVGFAAQRYFGLHATALLALFALAVVAHVAGNALGTRLRENGDTPLPGVGQSKLDLPVRRQPAPGDFAPATRLRDRYALGRPIMFATAAGTLVGGALGSLGMLLVLRPAPALSAVTLGAIACAVLAGIWTFVAFSFVQVAGGALWQATRDSGRKGRKN